MVSTDKNLLLENATREQAGVYIFEATSVRRRENNATEEVTGNASIIVEVRCKGISQELDIVLKGDVWPFFTLEDKNVFI